MIYFNYIPREKTVSYHACNFIVYFNLLSDLYLINLNVIQGRVLIESIKIPFKYVFCLNHLSPRGRLTTTFAFSVKSAHFSIHLTLIIRYLSLFQIGDVFAFVGINLESVLGEQPSCTAGRPASAHHLLAGPLWINHQHGGHSRRWPQRAGGGPHGRQAHQPAHLVAPRLQAAAPHQRYQGMRV